jgi:hypothetical protein
MKRIFIGLLLILPMMTIAPIVPVMATYGFSEFGED